MRSAAYRSAAFIPIRQKDRMNKSLQILVLCLVMSRFIISRTFFTGNARFLSATSLGTLYAIKG